MAIRNIYLKIEQIAEYSPVEPSGHAAANYRRDCIVTLDMKTERFRCLKWTRAASMR